MNTFARLITLLVAASAAQAAAPERWSAEKAGAWYAGLPWMAGCNYIPSSAINQLEMWQADTFDLPTIDRELGWAQQIGFTSIRVFLQDQLWTQDSEGFLRRLDQFLTTAEKHRIGVMFVLFDSCWDPEPKLGRQRDPKPGLHNSGWVQSPGRAILLDESRHAALQAYVKGVVGRFKDDRRVQVWDVWNEPDNRNGSSYGDQEPANKEAIVRALLPKVFTWTREAGASQPLTAGLWHGNWSDLVHMSPMDRLLVEQSDVISFHCYGKAEELSQRIAQLQKLGRPLLCTEYMARPAGSTFDPHLDIMKAAKVAAYNWGFVDGKSQTIYPWDSWKNPYASEPPVWFHDVFRRDGTPYRPEETAYIHRVTGAP